MVVLMPLLFLILFAGVQGALFYHARSLAIAAAQEGARAASAQHGSIADGTAAATDFLHQAAGDSLTHLQVTVTRTATTATNTVTGTSLSVVPGWTLTVDQSASLPVERITR